MRVNAVENFRTGNHKYNLSSGNKVADIELITTRKEKPEFDVNREIANRTFIRPLPPKGHIVNSSILSAPRDFVDDLITDAKAFKAAWSGEANDHQLGKLNDLGMKLGGLAIATYLFTMRHTPITKAMEFVGLGSFFASMAIWPKIALDLPARAIHGFSPFMRYEDSQGRKKRFFADNQYIPFDMLSDKDIKRIGNRLRIPENQPNRREAVEEKMRQIALQNNTMWMLTAGFATPILSSLICNAAEPYVEKGYSFLMNKKIDSIMENFAEQSKKFKTQDINKRVENLIAAHNNKPITPEVIKEFSKALTSQLGPNVRLGVEQDLTNLFIDNKFKITEIQIKPIAARIESLITTAAANKLLPQTIKAILPTEEQLTTLFAEKGYLAQPQSKLEVQNIVRDISSILAQNINKLNQTEGMTIKPNMQRRLGNALGKAGSDSTALISLLQSRPANVLDEAAQNTLRGLSRIITDVSAEHTALNVFAFHKLAQAPNTAKAKYWNDSVQSIIKTLGITSREIDETHYDRKLVGELFNKKIWERATAEPAEYKKFINELAAAISQIDVHVKPSELNGKFLNQAQTSYKNAASALNSAGFSATAKRLIRTDGKETGTLLGITRTFVTGSLTNLSATFSALLNKANVYRTIYKDPNLSFIGGQNIPKEVKEEIVGLIEYLTTEGRISDYSVKFDFLRNLTPDKTVAPLTIKGKEGIKYAHYNTEKLTKNGVIIKSDVNFFRNVIKTLFGIGIDSETTSALSEYSGVGNLLKEYRKNMITAVANLENFMFPDHVMLDENWNRHYSTATPKVRSNTVGAPLDDVLTNSLKQMYNTKKWLKMFGGFGAGLLGITVLSQFMFGRGDNAKILKKNKA